MISTAVKWTGWVLIFAVFFLGTYVLIDHKFLIAMVSLLMVNCIGGSISLIYCWLRHDYTGDIKYHNRAEAIRFCASASMTGILVCMVFRYYYG